MVLRRDQKLFPHFGEAGTAVFAVEEVEYGGHDRTPSLIIATLSFLSGCKGDLDHSQAQRSRHSNGARTGQQMARVLQPRLGALEALVRGGFASSCISRPAIGFVADIVAHLDCISPDFNGLAAQIAIEIAAKN
jgi:hypothetical protein